MKNIWIHTAIAVALLTSASAQAQNIISFNHATSSGGGVLPADPLVAAETAGATGYNDDNWNNLRSDWSGTSGAIPNPILYNDGTTVSGLTIEYDAPNAWNNGIATTTGDLKMMKNYQDSSAGDSPYVKLSGVPFRKFDVVVYADGDGDSNVDGPYVLRYGTGATQQTEQAELSTNVTNLLRPVVWLKESGDFSGTYTQVSTTTSLSVAGAATGNYMVFPGIKGNFTIDPTQTTATTRAPLNGYQLVKWETTNAIPGADDATAKVALYSGNVTVSANRTIGSLATSVGTYGDLIINPGVTLTLANGDLDMGDINHWAKGGGSITSSTNTLTISRDISNGLNYVGGAADAAIDSVSLIDNGGNALNVIKSGAGKLRMKNSQPYTGTTTVSQGSVEALNASAFGAASSAIQLNDATTSFFGTGLYLGNGINLSRDINVANQGRGTATLGTLQGSGTQTFSGNITLNKSATLTAPSGGTVNFGTGVLSGTGGIVKTDAGVVNLNSANTYTGTTTVNGGTLNLLGTGRIYATGGFFGGGGVTNVLVNSGGTLVVDKYDYGAGNSFSEMRNNYFAMSINGGTLRVTGTNSSVRAFSIGNGGATLDVPTGSSFTKLAGTLGSQNVIHNAGSNALTLTGGGTGTIQDALGAQGTWTTAAITKTGAGTWTLTGANTYGGATTVSAGTLLVNNTTGSGLGSGNAVVNGGILGGTGAFTGTATINAGGSLAPGASIESLATGALTLNNGSTFQYELDSSNLNGDLVLANGLLDLNATTTLTLTETASGTLTPGSKLTLVNYSGAWNSGTFTYLSNPLLDDSTFTLNSNTWKINYNDTTGGSNFASEQGQFGTNSYVTLTVVPEPGSFAMLLIGAVYFCMLGRKRRG